MSAYYVVHKDKSGEVKVTPFDRKNDAKWFGKRQKECGDKVFVGAQQYNTKHFSDEEFSSGLMIFMEWPDGQASAGTAPFHWRCRNMRQRYRRYFKTLQKRQAMYKECNVKMIREIK